MARFVILHTINDFASREHKITGKTGGGGGGINGKEKDKKTFPSCHLFTRCLTSYEFLFTLICC